MPSRTIHVCVNVRGALLNWRDRHWRGVVSQDGRALSPREVKAAFLQALAEGKEVLPMGEPCEGFDYGGGGCPGHEVARVGTQGEGE